MQMKSCSWSAALALALMACGSDDGAGFDSETTSETTAETTSEATSETDGDSSTGDDCTPGTEDCPCTSDDMCEAGQVCTEGLCVDPECGDGVVEGSEACDDGNGDDTDACLGTCELASCGDGFVHAGVEECDDQNTDNDDGCVETCTLPTCGDGFVSPSEGETCDDADMVDHNGCDTDCSQSVGVKNITGGGFHTCAVSWAGEVKCWGRSVHGAMGYVGALQVNTPAQVDPVELSAPAIDIVAGGYHTCAILEGGGATCWGLGDSGQLGNGATVNIGDDESPLVLDPIDLGEASVRALAAGAYFTCALLDDGVVRCWGRNDRGQLGLGHTQNIGDNELPLAAEALELGEPAVHIAAGWHDACAVTESGRLLCWGYNDEGQLGLGHRDVIGDNEAPAEVDHGEGAVAEVALTRNQNACVRYEDGGVKCWGVGDTGINGQGSIDIIGDNESPASTPVIELGALAVDISISERVVCALVEDGAIYCWGEGMYGYNGNGVPVVIGDNEPLLGNLVDVGIPTLWLGNGPNHTNQCVVTQAGGARCWGFGGFGQLGQDGEGHIGLDVAPADVPDIELGW